MPGESGTAAAPETDRWIRRDGEPRLLDRPYALALLPAGGPALQSSLIFFFFLFNPPHPPSLSFCRYLKYLWFPWQPCFLFSSPEEERKKKFAISPFSFCCCASGSMLLADWLFQRTMAVLLRCLFLFFFLFSVLPLCHFKGFEIRAPCRASKFCGSAVLSRWMWSAGVTLSFRPLRYFWGAKVPRVPTQWRGRRIRRRALPVVLFPTFFPRFFKRLNKMPRVSATDSI